MVLLCNEYIIILNNLIFNKNLKGELKQILEGPEDIEWADWHSKGNAVLAGNNICL
jgi:hypothetical protein